MFGEKTAPLKNQKSGSFGRKMRDFRPKNGENALFGAVLGAFWAKKIGENVTHSGYIGRIGRKKTRKYMI